MTYFAKAPMPRDQIVLFPVKLDDAIPEDHPVRILSELLDAVDWSEWNGAYHGSRGQPPIPPKVLAAILLYGNRQRVRSSRVLEYLCAHNVDFMWLAEGHEPDHSTLCNFRTEFHKQLRGLFRQVVRIAQAVGLIRFIEVGFDGTRVKANNSRYETWTAEKIEKQLAELEAEFGRRLEEMQRTDEAEQPLWPAEEQADQLPPELATLAKRRAVLEAAREQAQRMDQARRSEGIDPQRHPAQIPATDPDARVLPNKEGGYAPNYTPLAATDGHKGFLVDADVIASTDEQSQTVDMVDRVKATTGEKPETLMADGLHATGGNIVALEARGVEFLSPLASQEPTREHPARRDDPRQPVPEAVWPKLPINPQSKCLDKSCFLYDAEQDIYYCPLGKPLEFSHRKPDRRQGEQVELRVFQCASCSGCPLAGKCISPKNRGGRTVTRDQYAADRERHAQKMATEDTRKRYGRRMWIAETPFALIKQGFGVRQFLLRGMQKVKTEWLWTGTAFNLHKLIHEIQRMRAKFAAQLAIEQC